MAKRVTEEDIYLMNETYYNYKSYAETARRTGWSAATVRKYVDSSFVPIQNDQITRFDKAILPLDITQFTNVTNLGDLCELTSEEREELNNNRKEIKL